ncbi:MAG: glutamate--tRNA ligase [Candidatus Andersenbacteria bacterium]
MQQDPQNRVETAPRVRIAPSPTGGLHIGTARTALFNWLFARKHKGTFILRIEDTDRARSTTQFEQAIIEDLKWLGLNWDEGPIRQTERAKLHGPYLDQLLKADLAYFCYCTTEELEKDRKAALKAGKAPIYGGRCCELTAEQREAHHKAGRRGVVRFRAVREPIEVYDEVHGKLSFHGGDFGDFVIAKPSGTTKSGAGTHEPLFLLANIIDDALMQITHVIRGEDHLPNLPKQVLLAQALGFNLPKYAHIPLILNPDRSKMSKRAGPTHVGEYRKLGYLPEAIVNYIALLGWNPGTTQELFTREQLTEAFNLRQINKSGSVFDLKRLQWVNAQYLRKLPLDQLAHLAEPFWTGPSDLKRRALTMVQERLTHLAELPELTEFYFAKTLTVDPKLLTWKKSTAAESKKALAEVREHVATLSTTDLKSPTTIEQSLKLFAQKTKRSVGEVFWPLRVALSGRTASPGPQEIIWVLGQKKALERIDACL